jgi:glutamine synthetase
MDLLIKQYEQEGGKILGKLEQRHQNQRATVIQALDHKKMEMLSIYSEAKELVLETANELKENATSQFEREWRKTQDAIRAEISEGRKVSET